VKVLALTDHDTMAGVVKAMETAKEFSIRIIPAVEISAVYLPRPLKLWVATPSATESEPDAAKLKCYGISEDLREFNNGMTIITFCNFPLQDELEMSDVSTVLNVPQDLERMAG